MSGMIDTLTVQVFAGKLIPAHRAITTFTRPGVVGVGAVVDSYRSEPVDVTTYTTAASYANALTILEKYRKLEGQSVGVLDQFADIWPNVLVLSAVATIDQCAVIVGGAQATDRFLITGQWKLLVPSEEPAGLA
jgi:hypothetical protein